MSKNFSSLAKRSISVEDQKPVPYSFIDDPYPEYIQIKRIPGIITGNKVNFEAHVFDPNYYLRSRAYIKLSVQMSRNEREADGTLTNVAWQAEDVIFKKPGMLLANSLVSQKLRLNGNAITLQDQRYWQQKMTAQHCGKTINDRYLSGSGSNYLHNLGANDEFGVIDTSYGDEGLSSAMDDARIDIQTGDTESIIEYMEYVNIGLFNFMTDERDDIYPKSFFRRMSPLIPYVKQVGIEMQFKDIAANSFVFLYGLNTNGGTVASIVLRDDVILSAELVLTWVKPRLSIRSLVPPVVKLQSWFVDHHTFNLTNLADGAVVIPYDGPGTAQVDIQNLSIHQVPSYMIMWATVNKDDPASYDCRSVNADSDGAAADAAVSLDTNSQETHMLPVSGLNIRINVLGGNDIIDINYNNNELYRFTVKNSHNDFPWNSNKFIGKAADDIDPTFAKYPSKFFFILAEDDLNSFNVRKGQTVRDLVLNINGVLANGDGYGIEKSIAGIGDTAGDKQFKFHLSLVYDRYYYQLDKCGNVYTDFDARFL